MQQLIKKHPLIRTIAAAAVAILAVLGEIAPSQAQRSGIKFEIGIPATVRSEPATGRMFVMLSRNPKQEPRFQVGRTGVPFFGIDVENLTPGRPAVIDDRVLGSPVENMRDIPAGEYFVQALFNVYTRFERSDGKVVWMHQDQWEGQNWKRSPGNVYSEVKKLNIDPAKDGTVRLELTKVIPPVDIPPDTKYVKRIKIQSATLTKFWGQPMYLGAVALLPEGYDTHPNVSYPAVFSEGHFSLNAPFGFNETNEFSQAWRGADFPRFIAVTLQHPCPYFDDSYAVNSVNCGPYGDAVHRELIPEIEKRFRCIPESYARVVTGGSTGGWISVALQVWYPEFYGGCWAFAPDPVDFRNVEGINIYDDKNAFYKIHEWYKAPIPNTRVPQTGEITLTSEQRNHFELVNGTKGRSGEQLDIWSAVFGPLGEDGYFKPLFDKQTGTIDPAVAQYWKEHYDIRYYLEQNWKTIGPKLAGKLHIFCGDMDNFFLNIGVRHLEAFLERTRDPYYAGAFTYGAMGGHGWRPMTTAQLLQLMAVHILKNTPPGRSKDWRY
jgi:hypothetical protein